MRKYIIILIFTIMLIKPLPANAEKIIYLNEKIDAAASKILYEYELKYHKMTPEQAYEAFGYELSVSRAVFCDLNSDGINEIVGYMDVPYSFGVAGANVFILRKEKDGYQDISWVHTYPHLGIHILDTKTNGYSDIKVYTGIELKPTMVKYNKKNEDYEYFFPN